MLLLSSSFTLALPLLPRRHGKLERDADFILVASLLRCISFTGGRRHAKFGEGYCSSCCCCFTLALPLLQWADGMPKLEKDAVFVLVAGAFRHDQRPPCSQTLEASACSHTLKAAAMLSDTAYIMILEHGAAARVGCAVWGEAALAIKGMAVEFLYRIYPCSGDGIARGFCFALISEAVQVGKGPMFSDFRVRDRLRGLSFISAACI